MYKYWITVLYIATTWCLVKSIPFYEVSCPFTFEPETSIFSLVDVLLPFDCSWTFQAENHQTFQIVIDEILVTSEAGEEANCSENFIQVTEYSSNVVHDNPETDSPDNSLSGFLFGPVCTNVSSAVVITSSGNSLHILAQGRSHNIEFHATLQIVNPLVRYDVIKTRKTWHNANEYCQQSGGMLAQTYPVVTVALADIIQEEGGQGKVWVGKAISPWILKSGCIKWIDSISQLPNIVSKYNQVSECSQFCLGSDVMLLQNTSCYCTNETVGMETTYSSKCNVECPGQPTEQCGGVTSLTQYQYFRSSVEFENTGRHCVTSTYHRFSAELCSELHGFTCSLGNGSDHIVSDDLLPWTHASHYCDQLPHSNGLSPIPVFPSTYSGNPFWTSAIRTTDWNYPSVVRRYPAFAYLAKRDVYGLYKEVVKSASETYGFVCQYDVTSCHSNMEEQQVLKSPGYPGAYSSSQTCEWTVSVLADQVIKISFIDLDIEWSHGCVYDYLKITDGQNVIMLCGNHTPVAMVTNSNHIVIQFHSDATMSATGFVLKWEPVQSMWNEASQSKQTGLNGAEVAMLSIFLILLFAVALALVTFKICKCRRRMRTQNTGVSTSVSNNLYDDSTFMITSSQTGASHNVYYNVGADCFLNDPSRPTDAHFKNVTGLGTRTSQGHTRQCNDVEAMQSEKEDSADMGVSASKVRCTSEWRGYKLDRTSGHVGAKHLTLEDIENIGRDAINVTAVNTCERPPVKDEKHYAGLDNEHKGEALPVQKNGANKGSETGTKSTDDTMSNDDSMSIHEYTGISFATRSPLVSSASGTYTELDEGQKKIAEPSLSNVYTEIDDVTHTETMPRNVHTDIDDMEKTVACPQDSITYANIPEDRDQYLLPHPNLGHTQSAHHYENVNEVKETEL